MSTNQYGDRANEVLRHQKHLEGFLTYVSLNRTDETIVVLTV